MISYWVLWFVITLPSGQLMHIPVEEHFASHEECEHEIPAWKDRIRSHFPDDVIPIYCEEFIPNLPTKEL